MAGTGSSIAAKKQQNTAAMIGAAAPSPQPRPIQAAQDTRMAMAAAPPDSRARGRSA
ncbi:hypothetical protein D3C87_2084840 [compost metagenome]